MFAIFYFIFGTIVGSFLNVVALRLNTGKTLSGRSGCFSCGKTLMWWELFPVLSFFILRGRCNKCKSKISWQYPLVEMLTGVIFLLTFFKYSDLIFTSPYLYVFYFILISLIFSVLIVILIYDYKHKIIPDKAVFLFIFLTLIYLLSTSNFLNIIAGPIFFLAVYAIWYLSNGRLIGFGDAKLVWGMGWLLGLIYGLSAIVIANIAGAIVGLILIAISYLKTSNKNKIGLKSEIPFAPFLILGTIIAFFFSVDILNLNLLLSLI